VLGGVIGGTNVKLAVPAAVSCAVPTRLMSEHTGAVLLQNFTVPLVTGVAPATTVAVSVTFAGNTTVPPEATVTPPFVIVSVVVVAVPAANAGTHPIAAIAMQAAIARTDSLLKKEQRARQGMNPADSWAGLFERMCDISKTKAATDAKL